MFLVPSISLRQLDSSVFSGSVPVPYIRQFLHRTRYLKKTCDFAKYHKIRGGPPHPQGGLAKKSEKPEKTLFFRRLRRAKPQFWCFQEFSDLLIFSTGKKFNLEEDLVVHIRFGGILLENLFIYIPSLAAYASFSAPVARFQCARLQKVTFFTSLHFLKNTPVFEDCH